MKRFKRFKQLAGFTLVEMLLVMVIVSMIVLMAANYLQQRTLEMRIDRTTTQMQQILNAGLAYYVVNNKWPAKISDLQGTYLPAAASGGSNKINSPWNATYVVASNITKSTNPPSMFFVYVPVTYASGSSAAAVANIIAGRLPLSYASGTTPPANSFPPNDGSCSLGSTSTTCYVVAAVNIPGQNLNNATAVNYSGIYHSGACVPVPTCPVDQTGLAMVPQIMVIPSSVAGSYGGGATANPTNQNTSNCKSTDVSQCNVKVYPISSFTAKAVGPVAATSGGGPPSCDGVITSAVCYSDKEGGAIINNPNTKYWRVCLSTVTEAGAVNPTNNIEGQVNGTVVAITRCASQQEGSGSNYSSFTVWSR